MIATVLCLLLLLYACGKKNEAEAQRKLAEEYAAQANKTLNECMQSRESLVTAIDSFRMQIEDFESRMNHIEFNGYDIDSTSTEEN